MTNQFDVYFYLRGGHVVKAPAVKHLETTRDPDGSFESYKIEWAGSPPMFFSFSLPDIVAISTIPPED